ncbi:hypothetical protein [Nocardia africana]
MLVVVADASEVGAEYALGGVEFGGIPKQAAAQHDRDEVAVWCRAFDPAASPMPGFGVLLGVVQHSQSVQCFWQAVQVSPSSQSAISSKSSINGRSA